MNFLYVILFFTYKVFYIKGLIFALAFKIRVKYVDIVSLPIKQNVVKYLLYLGYFRPTRLKLESAWVYYENP